MRQHALLLIPFALLIAACGGSDGTDSDELGVGDRDLNRCSLVSVDEAEGWLGNGVIAEPPDGVDGDPDGTACRYQLDGEPDSILLQVYNGEVFWAEEGSETRIGETFTGLGEDAYVQTGGVYFLQDDWSVSISRLLGNRVTDEHLMEMAELVSSRLPS